MAIHDLRSEQIKLLKFEKLIENEATRRAAGKTAKVAVLTAAASALAVPAASAAEKLGSTLPQEYASQIAQAAQHAGSQEGLISLAEVVLAVHSSVQAMGDKAGLAMLQADGGGTKGPPVEAIRSLLLGG